MNSVASARDFVAESPCGRQPGRFLARVSAGFVGLGRFIGKFPVACE